MSTTAEINYSDFSMITNDTPTSSLRVELAGTTPSVMVEWESDNKMRNAVIGSLLLIVNALTLVTVVRTRSLRPHIKLLVGSLTCTDMLMGVITLLPRLLPWHRLSHEPLCVVRFVGVLMSVYGTCLSVTAITIDRTLALNVPIIYRTSVTVPKTLLVVLAAWGLSAVLTAATLADGFPPSTSCELILVSTTRGLRLMGYVLLLCIVSICVLYAHLGMKLRRRMRQVQTELNLEVRGDDAQQTLSMKLEKRATVTAIVLAVCFLFGYLPLATYVLWVVYSGVDRMEEAKAQRLLIIISCPLSNCILDPIVYFWRLQDWNSGILGTCRKFVRGRSSNSSTTTGTLQLASYRRTTATERTDR